MVKDDINVESNDPTFPDTYIKKKLNSMYRKVAVKYPWMETEDAVVRDSEVGEYVNVPENIVPSSITRVVYNSERYDVINFEDFQKYKDEEGTDGPETMAAVYQNKIFIYPAMDAVIVDGLEIFGRVLPDRLVNNGDYTIFAANEDVEEVVINLAIGECKKKADKSQHATGRAIQKAAWDELKEIWKKASAQQSKQKNKGASMFSPIQIIPARGAYGRGNFETQ